MFPRIVSLHITNYKSIALAKIRLNPLTVLVGPNGSGKSNCIDALAFLQQALSENIEMAFQYRGGISAVRRKSLGHPTNIKLGLSMILDNNLTAIYAVKIAAKANRNFYVDYEYCETFIKKRNKRNSFVIRNGMFVKEISGVRAKITPDRFGLSIASATNEYRPVYDFLTSMRFYSIIPNRIRELQEPDAGDYLRRDGRNAAAVLKHLTDSKEYDNIYNKICLLLSHVSEGIEGVKYQSIGHKDTLQFLQDVGSKYPWKFDALNMSDGTLRVLGLLLSVYQIGFNPVVCIEEPESTVNPAVAEIIFQVLTDSSKFRQIIITTHSPDILDQKELSDDQIRVVTMDKGRTIVAPVSKAARQAIREKLYTPGELLRIGELNPSN